ncbi:hypothetical protein J6590_100801 [Homalodisca vitripennis]|nr:hypothetical protein J6590_100801 [Homalodisca vitripennis]
MKMVINIKNADIVVTKNLILSGDKNRVKQTEKRVDCLPNSVEQLHSRQRLQLADQYSLTAPRYLIALRTGRRTVISILFFDSIIY